MDPQDREHSSPYDPPAPSGSPPVSPPNAPPPGAPYDPQQQRSPYDAPPPGSPHDAPPPGSPYDPQQQRSPYDPQQQRSPYETPAEATPRFSTVRTVLGIVCLTLGGLFILAALGNLAVNGPPSFRIDPSYATGYVIGNVLFPGIFIVAGVLLLRRPKR